MLDEAGCPMKIKRGEYSGTHIRKWLVRRKDKPEKKKRGEYRESHRWSTIGAVGCGVLVLLAVYGLFLRPEYDLYNEPLNQATVFLPLVLYSYNAILIAFSIMAVAIALGLWLYIKDKDGIAVSIALASPVFLCGCCLLSTRDMKYEFNFLKWGVNFDLQDTITANDHVYHLILSHGHFGYGGGYIFECDMTGLFCRAVHAEPWSTESYFNRHPPQFYLEHDVDRIKVMVGEEELGSYRFASIASLR
jgi:hypothetical protein